MMTRGVLDAKLAVVTTDYDFQGLWLSVFNHYFVARDETKAYMVAIGVPADRITVSGIQFSPVWAMRSTGKRFSGVMTCGGSANLFRSRPGRPAARTQTIVQQTLRMRNDFQAVVVCGRNDQLKSQIEGLVAFNRDRYRVLGYTTTCPT